MGKQELERHIIKRYAEDKKSSVFISNEIGYSKKFVLDTLVRNNIERRDPRWKDKIINEILNKEHLTYLYNEKKLSAEKIKDYIENKFNKKVSKSRILNRMKELGIERRTISDAHSVIAAGGYRIMTKGDKNGKRLHVEIAEKYIGRKLNKQEVVHHIDSKPLNNSPKNLFIFKTQSQHMRFHSLSNLYPEIKLESNLNRFKKGWITKNEPNNL